MRRRSALAALVVLLVVVGLVYYAYNYRNRDLSADITAMKEYTGDVATTSAVKTALALNKQLSVLDVHVDSSDNNVTLSGTVPTEDDRRVAEEIARSTKGVASVVNNLQVDSATVVADKQEAPDLKIKVAVLEAISSSPDLKTQQIKVDVDKGQVRLSGNVATAAQKSEVEAAARRVSNVRNVDSKGLAVSAKGNG